MVDSDDEDILYANDLGRNLIGGKREKTVDDVLNGDKKDKRKLRKTLALCMAFLCLGLCLAILGPTLLSLQQHLHTTLPKISWVFAGRSIGYLSGAILGGMLFETFNPLFLLAVCLLLCGIGIVIAPFVTTVMFLAICISSVGISMGVLDTGANLLCLRMWGKKRSGTMLQALHFSFALGAFIAPLVAAPFLAKPSVVEPNSTMSAVEPTSTMLAGGNTSPTPLQNQTLDVTVVNQILGVADGVGTSHGKNENIGLGGKKVDGSKGDKSISRMKRSVTSDKVKTVSEDNQETTLTIESTMTTSGSTTMTGASSTTTVASTTTSASTITTGGKSTMGSSSITTGASTTVTTGSSIAMGGKSTMTGGSSTTTGASTTARGSSTTAGRSTVTGASPTKTTVSVTTSPSPPQRQVERFAIAYIIIGVLVLVNSGVFFYFLCTKPKHEPQYTGSDQANDTSDKNSFPFRTRILILLFFFYFLYVGGEVAYGSFVSVFASKSHYQNPFEQDRASHVAAVFWGIFSLGRGLAICLASVISPLKMVIMDMVGCVATSLALTLFADRYENVLWIGSALLGLSMASLFPSGIAWLESYTPVTGNTASFLIVGSALGEMCVPVVIGYLFNQSIPGPMVLMYWMLATSGLSLFIFIYVMWLVMENGQEKKSLPAEKSPALELFQSVEEALPMEELFKNSGSNGKQMGKARIPPILKKKDHKE